MAPRDERVHSEDEANRYQSASYHLQGHRKPRMKVCSGQFSHQSSRPEGSSYGRGHYSPADNKPYGQALVARKSARTGNQPARYGRGRPRDPIKSKAIERLDQNPPDSPHMNIPPLEKLSLKGPSPNRHTIHQATVRNSGKEVGRYSKNHQVMDRTHWKRDNYPGHKNTCIENLMDRQICEPIEDSSYRMPNLETHTSESARGDDSGHRFRSRSSTAGDELGQYHRRNGTSIAKAEKLSGLNRISGLYSEYPPRRTQNHSTARSQDQTPSTLIQRALSGPSPSRQRHSPPALRLTASVLHSDSNNPSTSSAANGKPPNETDVVTPISTSAMSISSGSTPSYPASSSNRKTPHHRKFTLCITCKRPGAPAVGILVRCAECHISYHVSCHEPRPTLNRQGEVDEFWKCQRCIVRSRLSSDIPASMGRSSNSATLSEISSVSSENSATQISRGIIELSLDTGKSEMSGNLPGQDINLYREDVHFDSDAAYPRKRFKSNITTQCNLNGALRPAAAIDIPRKSFERSEYEELSRSPSIFPGNRTIAVVIGNQSRGTSASIHGRKNYQDANSRLEIPTVVRDYQEMPEWMSRVRRPTNLHYTPSPTSYQNSQPVIICSGDDETPNPPARISSILSPEIKDSQELEEELTDAPMSLDSPDVYSPIQEEHNIINRTNRDYIVSSVWGNSDAHWRSLEENRSYVSHGRLTYGGNLEAPPGKNSPQYPPSVGDCGKDGNGEPTSREHRDMSSPPYSPPPPDISETVAELVDTPCIPLPQTTLQEEKQINDDGFYCKECTFYVANNGQYKDKLFCGSCVIKPTLQRNVHSIPDSSPKSSQEMRRLTQPPVLASKQPSWNHRHRHPEAFKPASSVISDSPDLYMAGKTDEVPKNLDSREVALNDAIPLPVKKYQTTKAIVVEKYQMRFPRPPEPVAKPKPRITNKRKREESIKSVPRLHIDVSEIPDKRGKGKAVTISEECRKSGKSCNLMGPARKFPSKSTPPTISPPPKNSMNTSVDRRTARDDSVSSRKAERRGPAMKSAGRLIRIPHVSDSSDSDEKDSEDRLKELERRLQEQKGYTKKQMEKAVKLQNKLMETEREKKEIQEKLDISLSANKKPAGSASPKQARKIKGSKRFVQPDRKDETERCDQPVQFTAGSCAIEFKNGPSFKELYKDYKFTASVPWFCPPEIPAPDPSTFRKPGWRKPQEGAPGYDNERKMKVHVHRQLTRDNRQPLKITAEPFVYSSSCHLGNSQSASLNDEFDGFCWPLGGRETTIDEFMGFPDNMVPAVKDGILGFRPGIINQRTRRLDRNVQHYRIRAPGVLMDRV